MGVAGRIIVLTLVMLLLLAGTVQGDEWLDDFDPTQASPKDAALMSVSHFTPQQAVWANVEMICTDGLASDGRPLPTGFESRENCEGDGRVHCDLEGANDLFLAGILLPYGREGYEGDSNHKGNTAYSVVKVCYADGTDSNGMSYAGIFYYSWAKAGGLPCASDRCEFRSSTDYDEVSLAVDDASAFIEFEPGSDRTIGKDCYQFGLTFAGTGVNLPVCVYKAAIDSQVTTGAAAAWSTSTSNTRYDAEAGYEVKVMYPANKGMVIDYRIETRWHHDVSWWFDHQDLLFSEGQFSLVDGQLDLELLESPID